MAKLPHKYTVRIDGEYSNLVTRRFVIKHRGMNYFNEISSLTEDEMPVFSLLRELVKAKHQLIEDIYRIERNLHEV